MSRKYVMREKYRTNELVVANMQYISNQEDPHVPMLITSEQKYIFEIIRKKSGNNIYREVFTGCEFSGKPSYEKCHGIEVVIWDYPHVVDVEPLNEIVNNVADVIPKYALLLVLNEVNEKRSSKKFNK